ncbi:hypothetical protein ABTO99_06870 [Acinetobacter baumannii]
MSALHTSPKFTGFFRRLVEEKHVSAATMQTALDAAKRAKQDTVAWLCCTNLAYKVYSVL